MAMVRPAATVVFLLASCCNLAAGAQNGQLDGSGTTNPSKFFWQIMETIQGRAKRDVRFTYRAVGSSTGQKEFSQVSDGVYTGSVSDFGAGDIPMTQARFAAMATASRGVVHVPFCLGAIAVFHSIPVDEVGPDGLKLSPCLLAKIFSGQVATWDHADILAENANLKVPAGTAIQVGRRTTGSSSTTGLTEYMAAKDSGGCMGSLVAGSSNNNWPATFIAVEGSPGMTDLIQNTPYAIGYLDAGHGHQRNFREAQLQNEDLNYLTSTAAMASNDTNGNNGISAAYAAAVTAGTIPGDWSTTFENANLYSKVGPDTWPIVLISYIYVPADISGMSADKQALLAAFVDMVTSDEGQNMLKDYSFDKVPNVATNWASAWASKVTNTLTTNVYSDELSTTAWEGQGDWIISAKRSSYSMWKLGEVQLAMDAMQARLQTLETALNDNGIVALHGSGTTNPKSWFAKAMKLMEERARAPLHLTYRAVGSSTGQKEFVGDADSSNMPYNHFGAGDIPMTQSRYSTLTSASKHMVHIPIALGAIGVFHSVPADEIGSGVLQLSACLLAKIFSGQVTTWDHADVAAENPNINVPAGTTIQVRHRTLGSSSTGGISGYLDKKCPASWKKSGVALGAGSTIDWPTSSGFSPVEGSPGMQSAIAFTPYAIGYLDAGHGHDLNFAEVALTNADSQTRTSKEAIALGGVADAGAQGVTNSVFPTDPSADWSAVNLYDMAGANTWPIVLVSYMYVRKDQTATNPKTAAALQAFINITIENQDSLCEEFGFTVPDSNLKDRATTAAGDIMYPPGMEEFTFETSTDIIGGMAANVISVKRNSYDVYSNKVLTDQVSDISPRVQALETALDDYGIVALHGSGTTNPKSWFAKAMKLMEERARAPLHLTYRAVGSSTGQKEFVGDTASSNMPYNHFGAGDIPMTQSRYNTLSTFSPPKHMVHIPFALGAIGVFHSVPAGEIGADVLKLSTCLLAKIFSGQVTAWDHADVMAENPGISVPAREPIIVAHRTLGSSSTGGFSGYVNQKCPDSWKKGGVALGAGSTIDWPTSAGFTPVEGSPGMQNEIKTRKYVIGYIDAGHGHDLDFAEVALTNQAGQTRTSKESIALGGVADAGAQGVSTNTFPTDPSHDWSAVNLYDMDGTNTWPIVLVSYMYVRKDQTATNPKTAAALKAFISFITENQDSLCEEFGFTAPDSNLKSRATSAAGDIMYPPTMDEFSFETSTDIIGGMADNIISVKRNSHDVYSDSVLQGKIDKLMAELTTVKSQVDAKTGSNIQDLGGDGKEEDGGSDTGMMLAIVALSVSILSGIPGCAAFAATRKASSKASGGINTPGGETYGAQA